MSAKIKFTYDDNARKYEVSKAFEGVLPNLERRWRETDSSWVRVQQSAVFGGLGLQRLWSKQKAAGPTAAASNGAVRTPV
ncbi:hypothetical protein ASD25_26210 [Brevundimonas sp. Root1423]|nr:hypothetical protein [Brevundimonas sp. Root1423]KQY79261.1 hypothetical protein ASD25_26210 [Brevundimonas sp. Root1423]